MRQTRGFVSCLTANDGPSAWRTYVPLVFLYSGVRNEGTVQVDSKPHQEVLKVLETSLTCTGLLNFVATLTPAVFRRRETLTNRRCGFASHSDHIRIDGI